MMRGALLTLAIFSLSGLGTEMAQADSKTDDIPVIESLTGGGGFLGREEHDALVIAQTAFNKTGGIHGRPINFIFNDDQSQPQLALQLLGQVLADHPPLILGSTLVANCNAMAPMVKKGPVLYCFSPGVHPAAGSYMFTAGVSTFDQANALIRYFRLRGWTNLALMTSSDATGQDADHAFDSLLASPENKDIKIVSHQHFNPTDVSVSAQLERIKQANPQAFIAWATGSPSATMFRDAQQAGLDVPMGTTGGNMTYAQMDGFAAFLPKQLYLPSSEWPVGDDPNGNLQPAVKAKQTEFYAAYKEAGKKPDEGSVLAWDPASILIDALRQLPENVTAAQLNDYLMALKGHAAISGEFDYTKSPQRGLSLDNVIITSWDKSVGRWPVVSKPTGVPLDK